MPTSSQLLLISEHPLLCEGMKALLRQEPDLRICCDATGGQNIVELINSTFLDLVLVDISLSTSASLQLIKTIRSRFPSLPILAWTIVADSLHAERALAAGARGFLEADEICSELPAAVRQVLNGNLYVSSAVADRMILRSINGVPLAENGGNGALSRRELEIFRQLGRGRTTQEIAAELHISPKTVESHRFHIREKLGLRNNSALIREATRWAIEDDRVLIGT